MADHSTPARPDYIGKLESERDRLREALEEIAKGDALVDANEDVFSVHAFRRCREIARWALGPEVKKPRNRAGRAGDDPA